MDTMLAFHNKDSVKKKYLDRVKAHYEADEIIQGIYWENGKGCAVGCTMEMSENIHKAMEKTLGIPVSLAYLEDRLFEGYQMVKQKSFPYAFLKQ